MHSSPSIPWLTTIFEGVSDAVICVSDDGLIAYINPVAETLSGWKCGEIAGKRLTDVLLFADRKAIPAGHGRSRSPQASGRVPLAAGTALIDPAGNHRLVSGQICPLPKGEGSGSILLLREASGSVDAFDIESIAQQRSLAILESITDAFFAVSREWLFTYINAEGQRVLARRPSEILGKNIWEEYPGLIGSAFEAMYRRVMGGGPAESVNAYYPDHDRWYEVHTYPSSEGISVYFRDVSERHRAEEALRRSEERYRTLFGSIDEGFCVLEMIFDDAMQPVDYRFLEINPAFEKHTGIHNASGRSIREMGIDLEPHWFETYGQVALTGEQIRFTQGAAALEGRWFDVHAFRLGGEESRKVAVLFSDITQRRRAEEALRSSEEHLQLAVNIARMGTFQIDLSTDAVTVNEMGRSIYGWPEGEPLTFRKVQQHFHPEDREAVLQSVQEAMEPAGSREFEVEQRIIRTDGEIRWIRVRGRVLFASGEDGLEPSRCVGTYLDISKAKQAEETLRENERRFRTLVEQVEDYAIFVTDTSGRPTTWNEGVRLILGFVEDEFIGRDIAEMIYTPEDIHQGVPARELAQAAAEGRSAEDRWMRRKDGELFFALGATTRLIGPAGELLGFMRVMRDQTSRKRIEDELRQAATELSEADRRKNVFLATLAHELRNPLAPIRTGLELLKLRTDDLNSVQQIRETMERQVGQMVRLIDDLLDISRITQGKLTLRTQVVSLSAVLQSAVEAARPIIDEFGHRLSVSIPQQPLWLEADPNRLAQVFSNLLNNAAKYTNGGGQIWLTVEVDPTDAQEPPLTAERGVHISVRDTGLGIPAEMLDHIFEMFTQIDRPLEKGHTGLGIGLTLVKRLVEMHGGRIAVHSEGAGRGSEFRVSLPLPAAAETESATPQSLDQGGSQLRVLVVDDNADAAKLLAMMVRAMGNDTQTAFDGAEGVSLAEQFRPDVVLMDLGMPKMTGYEAVAQIRSHAWGSEMIVVALTGWGQEEDKRRTREAGFDDHLVKPAEPAALRAILAAAAAKRDSSAGTH